MEIKKLFNILHGFGFVRSQMEFSQLWLGRSPRYYSSLIATGREPGPATLLALADWLHHVHGAYDRANHQYAASLPLMEKIIRLHLELQSISHWLEHGDCRPGKSCGSSDFAVCNRHHGKSAHAASWQNQSF